MVLRKSLKGLEKPLAESAVKTKKRTLKEESTRLQRLLDELEDLVSNSFFISLMGKVVVDEKRLHGIISELRKLEFNVAPAERETRSAPIPEDAGDMVKHAYADAENIKRGANEYAMDLLEELSRHVEKSLSSIKEGQRVLNERLEK